jgi:membrane peptidoglycan carboxypeptidase
MANAYATLAGDGKYCDPTPIQQITTQDGEKLDVGKPHCIQATTPDVARAALDAAAARWRPLPARELWRRHAPQVRGIVGHPVYGKTGTTDHDKTAALIVGTTSLVVAGYLVNPDYADHPDRMQHSVVNPAVWEAMADYMDGKAEGAVQETGEQQDRIRRSAVHPRRDVDSIGRPSRLSGAGFEVSGRRPVDSKCPAGHVADQPGRPHIKAAR